MKVAAKPLSRREWAKVNERDHIGRDRAGSDLVVLTRDELNRIEATFGPGLQPDEPTNDELNEWAARDVMGWERRASTVGVWLDRQSGQFTVAADLWAPAERVDQALQVAMETDLDVDVDLSTHDECGHNVKTAFVTVDAFLVHEGPFEPDVIARKIMLALHERLEAQP